MLKESPRKCKCFQRCMHDRLQLHWSAFKFMTGYSITQTKPKILAGHRFRPCKHISLVSESHIFIAGSAPEFAGCPLLV
jgi:hypothetical protein